MILREATSAISQAKIGALIVDQAELAGGTVADHLNFPFVSVASPLPVHLEAETPYFAFTWPHGDSLMHRLPNPPRIHPIYNWTPPTNAHIHRSPARRHLP